MKREANRRFVIVAQDPSVRGRDGSVLMAKVEVPGEDLLPGPCGHRIKVVDYDASTDRLLPPARLGANGVSAGMTAARLLGDPSFHAQNAYAVAMRTLARFERALGRRVGFSFGGHQIHIAPHAFADANAFYSEEDRSLCFGYFAGPGGETVYTCLSHDVIAHEMAHALLDGMQTRYTDPSSEDQAAFHEGFADIVAILSLFSLADVIRHFLSLKDPKHCADGRIARALLTRDALRGSLLFGVAEQMGIALSKGRARALRESLHLHKLANWRRRREFREPHRRGEILVIGVMRALVDIWDRRLRELSGREGTRVNLQLVIEEGAKVAEHLLNIAIRALDYAPPTDLTFPDYLNALLTADYEAVPDDSRYGYRTRLLKRFGQLDVRPVGDTVRRGGRWDAFARPARLTYANVHRATMLSEPDEMYRFIWDNREALGLEPAAYTEVQSVRPAVRIAPDGFVLRETVATYIQILELRAEELAAFHIRKPARMRADQELRLFGGGQLVFDEFGALKYSITNRVTNRQRQTERLESLLAAGFFRGTDRRKGLFQRLHRMRMGASLDAGPALNREKWL